MFRNWTFGRRVGGGFAVAVVALVVIAVCGYRSAKDLIATTRWVTHTHLVRRQVAALHAEVLAAEAGQRGFVITGKDAFLEPYTSALGTLDKLYDEVRALTIDNPRQTRRLETLRQTLDSTLAQMKQGIELRRSAGFEQVIAAVTSGDGERLMTTIRAQIAEIDQEEGSLLDRRQRNAADSTEAAQLITLWGSVAAIILTSFAGWFITKSLSNQVGSAVQHIQSASTELQASAHQQATGAREQSTAMTEIATTISELLATSRQISDSAKRVSQIAGQTASAARNGEITVTRGHEAVATVRKQVDLIVEHMLALGKKSQQVGSVLDIVSELAEQTNILAINATIEAAGAGDAGRRFGVVADEIRKLADRVAASTKEIRTMVEDVRGAANTTVMATEAGSKAVDVGTAQVVEMATSFSQIASMVGTTTDAAREIELSTKQQATAVEQVNLAITNAAGATRQTEASARETLQTARQLTELSTSLVEIVQSSAH